VSLARINTILLIIILVINSYIIALPIVPKAVFWWQHRDPKHIQRLEAKIRTPSPAHQASTIPTDNRLIVPSMLFDQSIYEGKTAITLRKGLWLRPQGSTPDKGGNTVLVGHRLTYSNPRGTLYNLDKVHTGDDIGVWWNGRHYRYIVNQTRVVGPDEVSIEGPTKDSQLTIYTCTPLWLPKNRLVVIARLEKVE
jgi:sortase A